MDEGAQKDSLSSRVKESFGRGTRPGFLGGEGGGDAPSGSKAERRANERAAASGAAADSLKDAESSASGGLYHGGNNLDEAKEGESNPGGLYSSKTGKAISAAKDIKKGRFKGAFKKGGPIVGIFLVIFAIGGIMAGTQVFQPFSLISQLQDSFNSMHTSAEARAARFYKSQMDSGRYKKPLGNSIFGKHLKISQKQSDELKRQGIEYDEDYNGQRVLKYVNSNGEEKIVTADNFKDVYASDTEFFHKYNAGSMTWRGQFANWFTNTTNKFLQNNKLTRNMWKDYKKMAAEADAGGKSRLEMVKEQLGKRMKGGGDVEVRVTEETETIDEEGESHMGAETTGEKLTGADVSEKLGKIRSKFSNAANVGCAVVGVIGAISLMVAATEAIQILNLTTSYMETVDKTKYGEGDEAPINELTNTLNEQMVNENWVIKSTGGGGGVTEDGVGGLEAVKADAVSKSAMQSAGVSALYGNGLVDPNDPSAQSFNISSSMNRILGGIGVGMDAFRDCAIAKIAAGALGAAIDAVEIIACIGGALFTAGASCGPLVISSLAGIAASVGLAVAISGVISLITPVVVNAMTRDLVAELGGENLGNALTSGANMYQGFVHKANGGSLATTEKYQQFAIEQQRVIAQQAREERANLSPFDMTSKNTFMGSLMTQLMSFTTTNSLMNTIATSSSIISSSITALTPSTSAIASEIAKNLPNMDEYEKTSPHLASIGAIGDSYSNPYMASDLDTMDMDPDDVIQKVDSLGGFKSIKEAGNVIIDAGSELAKYIRYCAGRTSAFGVADQNIVNEINKGTSINTGNMLIDSAGNGFIGSVPILGDALDILESQKSLDNIGYISGESCVAGNNVDAAESPNWDEAKYYQRFIEDQSLAESMDLIDKSAVSVYLDEYYQENPLDNSYEGMLARYSGLDKETVSDVLDVLAYYEYVNAYDASERYAFGAPVIDEEEALQFDHENVMGGEAVVSENIVYADVRNRNFAV